MFMDLKGDASKTPDVFILPSLKLKPPLLVEYDNYTGLAICERDEKAKKAYLNRWDLVKAVLGSTSTS
jgi:hypothetical protein